MSLTKPLFHRESDFRPDRDWRFLFGSFLLVAIIVFAASIYLFRVLNTLEIVSQQRMTTTPSVRLDQKVLDQATAILDGKKSNLETFLKMPPVIVDPAR